MSEEVQAATRFVSTDADFRTALGICAAAPVVAVDTEFVRTNTYYPALGLLQLSDGNTCWLVDPLAVDVAAAGPLFADTNVTKVLHACSEDLEVFAHAVGVLPAPLYDTQIAAAILGDGFSLSYQVLIDLELGVHLAKDQTRSDWLARPLTGEQLQYAAQDVFYLVQAWEKQRRRLGERAAWVQEECANFPTPPSAADPAEAYLRIKGAGKLDADELHVLCVAASWRESFARERDVPRSRVAEDTSLIAVARGADSRGALSKAGMHPRSLRKYSADLLEMARAARRAGRGEASPQLPPYVPGNNSALMKTLKAHVARQAQRLGIDVQMLATRRHLEALLSTRDARGQVKLTTALAGWRRQLVGDDLVAIANGTTDGEPL